MKKLLCCITIIRSELISNSTVIVLNGFWKPSHVIRDLQRVGINKIG